jgi:hypothetical protein
MRPSTKKFHVCKPYRFHPVHFAILSTENHARRVIVGAVGEVFTIGAEQLQKLAAGGLVGRAQIGGRIREHENSHYELIIDRDLPLPLNIKFWKQPMLGLETVCAYDKKSREWYLWVPMK